MLDAGAGRNLAGGRNQMALLMKSECEKCRKALAAADAAYICVYECTFCAACAAEMGETCPNCGGELVRRPRPRAATAAGQGRTAQS